MTSDKPVHPCDEESFSSNTESSPCLLVGLPLTAVLTKLSPRGTSQSLSVAQQGRCEARASV